MQPIVVCWGGGEHVLLNRDTRLLTCLLMLLSRRAARALVI